MGFYTSAGLLGSGFIFREVRNSLGALGFKLMFLDSPDQLEQGPEESIQSYPFGEPLQDHSINRISYSVNSNLFIYEGPYSRTAKV